MLFKGIFFSFTFLLGMFLFFTLECILILGVFLLGLFKLCFLTTVLFVILGSCSQFKFGKSLGLSKLNSESWENLVCSVVAKSG